MYKSGTEPAPSQPGAPSTTRAHASAGSAAIVTVRYYAAARAATGVDSEQLTGTDVSAVLQTAVARHPALAPVLAVASVLADGRVCDRAAAVVDGLTLEVLPPFAGG